MLISHIYIPYKRNNGNLKNNKCKLKIGQLILMRYIQKIKINLTNKSRFKKVTIAVKTYLFNITERRGGGSGCYASNLNKLTRYSKKKKAF